MTAIAFDRSLSATAAQDPSREARFNALFGGYLDDLYRYARWLTGDLGVADDLVQETMLRAWKNMDRLNDKTSAKSWLITILRRENARRFERKRLQPSGIPAEELQDGHRDYDTSTEAFALRHALERLPEKYREPLLLQIIHGYSQKEIAAQLGISSAGVGTRLFRAREKLREMLGELAA